MKKILCLLTLTTSLLLNEQVSSHCQMPCGIYHDEMVYDQVDQYVETMYKAVTVLNDNKFATVKDRNEFVRWVMNKDKMSNEMADIFTTYFLQQKIKPSEEDSAPRVESAHKLLFLLVQIKQSVDVEIVKEFNHEWEKFKHMFHPDWYECAKEEEKKSEWEKYEKMHKSSDGKHPFGTAADHETSPAKKK